MNVDDNIAQRHTLDSFQTFVIYGQTDDTHSKNYDSFFFFSQRREFQNFVIVTWTDEPLYMCSPAILFFMPRTHWAQYVAANGTN